MEAKKVQETLDSVLGNAELLKFVETDTLNSVSELLWGAYCERVTKESDLDDLSRQQDYIDEDIQDSYESYGAINGFV